MDSSAGSGAWKFLITLAFIGIFVGFWLNEASKLSLGNALNMPYRSVLPISCSLAIDRVDETRRSAEAYFWQGSIRLDVHSVTTARKQHIHEIVKPDGSAYVWQDGSSYGDKHGSALQYKDIAGAEATRDWFCYPWLLIDFNLFSPPANLQFE